MMALGIKPNDEIITTPFTFIATSETIALIGIKPVFVDLMKKTYNIGPFKNGRYISRRKLKQLCQLGLIWVPTWRIWDCY